MVAPIGIQVQNELGCHYMNAQEFVCPGTADGIHLDAEGHRKLAMALCEKVKSIL